MVKNIKRVVFILFLIVIIIIIIMFKLIEEPYTTSEKIKKEFYNNYENILKISEYLINSQYAEITIHSNDYIYKDGKYGYWSAFDRNSESGIVGGSMPIGNKEVVDDISILFKEKKYQCIEKSENTVKFQLWANLDDGHGIVYSIDGNKPEMQFLTKLERLQKDNWYYYECNFNEWRNE